MPAHFLDDLTRRDTAIRLATYAVNGDKGRDRGDPVHEEVTEGRYAQWVDAKARKAPWAVGMVYSSCGDLVAWMLYRLGCRDERLVNRTADEGQTPWMPGRNVTNIVSHRAYCKAGRGAEPQPGDVLYELRPAGGHLDVLESWDAAAGVAWVLAYGQPGGRRRRRSIRPDGRGGWLVDGVTLDGWLDLDGVAWAAEPDLSGVDA